MNKILIAMVIAGSFHMSAAAKKTPVHNTERAHYKPAKISHRKAIAKDTVVMNFKICKSDNGYAICGEAPGSNNSTFEEPQKPKKHPVYEAAKSDVIELRGIPQPPKVAFPMDKQGPETQSGAWVGVSSWTGFW